MDTILEMRGIGKTFHGVVALDQVNLSVRRGEIHALVGENGAGKSTLMKILSGAAACRGLRRAASCFDGSEVSFRFKGIQRQRQRRRYRHHPPGAQPLVPLT